MPPSSSAWADSPEHESPEAGRDRRYLSGRRSSTALLSRPTGANNQVGSPHAQSDRWAWTESGPELRPVAQLKMLRSLAAKLNRLNDVRAIGDTITAELGSLIDYHNCRVFLLQ